MVIVIANKLYTHNNKKLVFFNYNMNFNFYYYNTKSAVDPIPQRQVVLCQPQLQAAAKHPVTCLSSQLTDSKTIAFFYLHFQKELTSSIHSTCGLSNFTVFELGPTIFLKINQISSYLLFLQSSYPLKIMPNI